jgi:hypothetical protein
MVGHETGDVFNRGEGQSQLRMHIQDDEERKLQDWWCLSDTNHSVQGKGIRSGVDSKLSPPSEGVLFIISIRFGGERRLRVERKAWTVVRNRVRVEQNGAIPHTYFVHRPLEKQRVDDNVCRNNRWRGSKPQTDPKSIGGGEH